MTKYCDYSSSEDECKKKYKCKRGKRGYPGFQGPQGPTGSILNCHTNVLRRTTTTGVSDFNGQPISFPIPSVQDCFINSGNTLTSTQNGAFFVSLNLQFQNTSSQPANVNVWLAFYDSNGNIFFNGDAFTLTVPSASNGSNGYITLNPSFIFVFSQGDIFGFRWSIMAGDPQAVSIYFQENQLNPGSNNSSLSVLEFLNLPANS